MLKKGMVAFEKRWMKRVSNSRLAKCRTISVIERNWAVEAGGTSTPWWW